MRGIPRCKLTGQLSLISWRFILMTWHNLSVQTKTKTWIAINITLSNLTRHGVKPDGHTNMTPGATLGNIPRFMWGVGWCSRGASCSKCYAQSRCHYLPFHSHTKSYTLQWPYNGRDGVSNHKPHGCLLNRLFGRWWTETSKLRVTGLCAGNSPVTQMASNAENVSIWWRHHVYLNPCLACWFQIIR